MKIAVTGATGLAFNAVGPLLHTSGFEFVPLGRESTNRDKLPPFLRSTELRVVDFSISDSVARSLQGVDAVMHLASNSKPSKVGEDEEAQNVRLERTMLEAVRQAGRIPIVSASSNWAAHAPELGYPFNLAATGNFGQLLLLERSGVQLPMIGPDWQCPSNAYGRGKVRVENIGQEFCEMYGIPYFYHRIGDLRPSNPDGTSTLRNEEGKLDVRWLSTWLFPDDAARLFEGVFRNIKELQQRRGNFVSNNRFRFLELPKGRLMADYLPKRDAFLECGAQFGIDLDQFYPMPKYRSL